MQIPVETPLKSRQEVIIEGEKFIIDNITQGLSKIGLKMDDSKYNIYPIPTTDITANPNLVQNPGY